MSGCKFPEHHSSGGGINIVPIAIVVGLVVLGASFITAIIHIMSMVLTFMGLGAAVSLAIGGPLWVHRRRASRQLVTQYQPQMTPGRRTSLPQEEPQTKAIEQHVHHHYGISLEELAQAIRNQGSPNGR